MSPLSPATQVDPGTSDSDATPGAGDPAAPDSGIDGNALGEPVEAMSIDDAAETVLGTIRDIADGFLGHLPLLVAGVIILILTAGLAYIARRVARRLLKPVSLRPSLKELIGRFVVIGVWAIGFLVAAMVTFPGLTPSKALTALGIGSLAIGLAFKDIFENFFAGVLILWRFPFENGDYITCKGITGRVVDVTVRNTELRTVSGELVVMPNIDLYKNAVDVLTSRSNRRIGIECGIAYGEDVAEARGVIRDAVTACSSVSSSEEVQVFARAFGASSIDFEVTWWSGSTPLEQRRSRDQVIEAIKSALNEHDIEIPFPHRTLTFNDPVPLSGMTSADAT